MTRITQGAISLLLDLKKEQIKKQIEYCLKQTYDVSIE